MLRHLCGRRSFSFQMTHIRVNVAYDPARLSPHRLLLSSFQHVVYSLGCHTSHTASQYWGDSPGTAGGAVHKEKNTLKEDLPSQHLYTCGILHVGLCSLLHCSLRLPCRLSNWSIRLKGVFGRGQPSNSTWELRPLTEQQGRVHVPRRGKRSFHFRSRWS